MVLTYEHGPDHTCHSYWGADRPPDSGTLYRTVPHSHKMNLLDIWDGPRFSCEKMDTSAKYRVGLLGRAVVDQVYSSAYEIHIAYAFGDPISSEEIGSYPFPFYDEIVNFFTPEESLGGMIYIVDDEKFALFLLTFS